MSKNTLYFLSLFLFLLAITSSCSVNEEAVPTGIIPQDTMINVMADIHLAESRLLLIGKYASNENTKSAYIQNVLMRSNIDTARFQSSFKFYMSKPELFKDMYDKVMEEISKRQAEKK